MEAESRKMFMEQFTSQIMKQMELYTRHGNTGRTNEGSNKWTTRTKEKKKDDDEECSDKELYNGNYGESKIEIEYGHELTKKSDSYINEGEMTEFGNEELNVETLVTCCDFETNVITFLPKLIYLAYMCPFEDIAVQCRYILERWQQYLNMPIFKIHMPLLSPFVYCNFNCQTKRHDHDHNRSHSHDSHSNQQHTNKNVNPFVLPGWKDKDNKILRLFQETFVRLGHVTNLDLLLSRHPTYWVDFTKFYEILMLGNGQMSHDWRYYVAIMAASRYDCAPLVGFLECQFQEFDGNYSWIDVGLRDAHPKLKKIALLNALLAHNPWTISPKHIAELVKGKQTSWSVSEIVEAMVIMTTFHGLCSFYQGFALSPEFDWYFRNLTQHGIENDFGTPVASLVCAMHRLIAHQRPSEKNCYENIHFDKNIPRYTNGDSTATCDDIHHDCKGCHEQPEDNHEENSKNNGYGQDNESDGTQDQEQREAKSSCTRNQHRPINSDVLATMAAKNLNSSLLLSGPTLKQLFQNTDIPCLSKSDDEMNFHTAAAASATTSTHASSKQQHSLRSSSESSELDGTTELRPDCAKGDITSSSSSVIRIGTEQKLIGGNQSLEKGNTSGAKKKKEKYVQRIFFANKTLSRSRSPTPSKKKKHSPSARHVSGNDTNQMHPVSAKETQTNPVAGATEQTQAQVKNDKVFHKLGLDNLRKPVNRSEKRMRKYLKKQYRRQQNQKDGSRIGHSIGCLPSGGDKLSKDTTMTNIPAHGGLVFGKYTDNIDMVHCDFDVHQFEQLNRVAFNWRDHAYSLLQRFCPFVIDHIDHCFSTAWTMANSTTARKYSEPSSSSTYLAIWNCVQAFYGIHDDSYDYKNVNISMRPQLKRFLKKIVCYPQSVTLHDIDRLGIPLEDHERIHIAILAIEAKKQASLIYGLRAVMRYVVSTG